MEVLLNGVKGHCPVYAAILLYEAIKLFFGYFLLIDEI